MSSYEQEKLAQYEKAREIACTLDGVKPATLVDILELRLSISNA